MKKTGKTKALITVLTLWMAFISILWFSFFVKFTETPDFTSWMRWSLICAFLSLPAVVILMVRELKKSADGQKTFTDKLFGALSFYNEENKSYFVMFLIVVLTLLLFIGGGIVVWVVFAAVLLTVVKLSKEVGFLKDRKRFFRTAYASLYVGVSLGVFLLGVSRMKSVGGFLPYFLAGLFLLLCILPFLLFLLFALQKKETASLFGIASSGKIPFLYGKSLKFSLIFCGCVVPVLLFALPFIQPLFTLYFLINAAVSFYA